jgi:hypothetical protein
VKKFASYFLALDQKFKITQNDIIKILINCQKITCKFWQLIKFFDQVKSLKKIRSTDYENFNQLKKHNFNQVNFGQMTPCP